MVLGNDHFSKDPLCYNETFSYLSTLHRTCRSKSKKNVDFNVCLLIR